MDMIAVVSSIFKEQTIEHKMIFKLKSDGLELTHGYSFFSN